MRASPPAGLCAFSPAHDALALAPGDGRVAVFDAGACNMPWPASLARGRLVARLQCSNKCGICALKQPCAGGARRPPPPNRNKPLLRRCRARCSDEAHQYCSQIHHTPRCDHSIPVILAGSGLLVQELSEAAPSSPLAPASGHLSLRASALTWVGPTVAKACFPFATPVYCMLP